ncbi:hypothetical protein WOLCODRAFT_154265 [Wolfiporia cocos MD-104 SS10]|uniref:Uncharacterized protein n=1 Tax=Wolfiporia cocos (strain MD-104) TaxID=742152 RepID=A0A2H3JQ01_WOLCO|nr:hypothetical protein WOLCODRAFT_154265 [Wolfiporia cocos MD-104 SS10]
MASSRLKTNIASFHPPTTHPPTSQLFRPSYAVPSPCHCESSTYSGQKCAAPLNLLIRLSPSSSHAQITTRVARRRVARATAVAIIPIPQSPDASQPTIEWYVFCNVKQQTTHSSTRLLGATDQNTADYRYEDAFRVAATLLAYTPNAAAGHEARDVGNSNHARHPTGMPERRQKLSDLVAHFALATRRRIARMGVLQKWTFPARFDFTTRP